MPHLAPMSWMFALFMIWTLITTINTMNWWSLPMKFSYYKSSSTKSKKLSWHWLQGGRE